MSPTAVADATLALDHGSADLHAYDGALPDLEMLAALAMVARPPEPAILRHLAGLTHAIGADPHDTSGTDPACATSPRSHSPSSLSA